MDKLTSIRLAEVLTQRGTVETDAITDALYAQDRQGEVFVDVLVDNGHVTEWDLAKIVVEHFQLPFIMASSIDVSDEAKEAIPEEMLFQNRIVPLGKFEDVLTISIPILTPYSALSRLQESAGVEVFPYVGLISENKQMLGSLFDGYSDWVKADTARKEERSRKARESKGGGKGGGNWMDMFDSADENVRKTLG